MLFTWLNQPITPVTFKRMMRMSCRNKITTERKNKKPYMNIYSKLFSPVLILQVCIDSCVFLSVLWEQICAAYKGYLWLFMAFVLSRVWDYNSYCYFIIYCSLLHPYCFLVYFSLTFFSSRLLHFELLAWGQLFTDG